MQWERMFVMGKSREGSDAIVEVTIVFSSFPLVIILFHLPQIFQVVTPNYMALTLTHFFWNQTDFFDHHWFQLGFDLTPKHPGMSQDEQGPTPRILFQTSKLEPFILFDQELFGFFALGIQSPCQMMIGEYNHLQNAKVFRFHETILSFGDWICRVG